MKFIRTYKYRLYPNKKQSMLLDDTLNVCRYLYNAALQERIDAYKKRRVSLSCYDQIKELPECKLYNEDLNLVYSQVLRDVLQRLDKAFKGFYRRLKSKKEKAGFPRFKGKDRYDSFTYPQHGFKLQDNKLVLSKIGAIKIKLNRLVEGKLKTLIVIRKNNKWYGCFCVEIEKGIRERRIKNAVGIDMGLMSFVTISNGDKIKNPKWFKKSEKKLAKEQRKLSRKNEGSNNRRKQRYNVGKVHEKISNQRRDFHHKLSRQLVNKYDLIAYEDLNIKKMVQNKRFSKSINDAAWNKFISMVLYKAEEAGVTMVGVNPQYTSQVCNVCNNHKTISLYDRLYICERCGNTEDRDVNAAKNILKIGLGEPEFTLVESSSKNSLKQEYTFN